MNIDPTAVPRIERLGLAGIGALWVRVSLCKGKVERIDLSVSRPGREMTPALFAPALLRLLSGELQDFPFPLDIHGTRFQKAVWMEARRILPGRLITYGGLASRLSCRSPRAVGQALARNPLPIIIPCHRVVGRDGGLTGFSCGIEIKRMLIEYESKRCAS